MKRYILVALTTVSLLCACLSPAAVFAASSKEEICEGIGGVTGNTDCSGGGAALSDTVASVINILSLIVGVLAVIMIIYGGFRYVTSAGDSGKVTAAKNVLLYAIVGVVLVAFAQAIVQFVLRRVG